jgi:hypothetical protein
VQLGRLARLAIPRHPCGTPIVFAAASSWALHPIFPLLIRNRLPESAGRSRIRFAECTDAKDDEGHRLLQPGIGHHAQFVPATTGPSAWRGVNLEAEAQDGKGAIQ